MDWSEVILTIVGVVLGGILSWLAANYLKTQKARYRAWNLAKAAESVVLWVQDYFTDWAGADKLKKAVDLIILKMDEAGWDDVPPTEAETAARVAYQEKIGIQKTMLEKAKALEAKFKSQETATESK